jgi:hypothetical protein
MTKFAVAVTSFEAEDAGELSILEGDRVLVLEDGEEGDWCVGLRL